MYACRIVYKLTYNLAQENLTVRMLLACTADGPFMSAVIEKQLSPVKSISAAR